MKILCRFTGKVIFESNHKTTKLTVRAAIESGANLSGSNLSGSDLSWSDLSRSNLSRSNLSGSDLSRSNLSGSDLSWSDLSRSNLSGAKRLYFQICPKGGSFTAWKTASKCVVELKIPAWAMRTSSIAGRKCRAEFAIVADIRDKNHKQVDSVRGDYSSGTIYKIGKIMKPDLYDPDPRVECSHGIHFFMTREEAERY